MIRYLEHKEFFLRILKWITDTFECIVNQLRVLEAQFIILPYVLLSIYRYLLFNKLKNYLTGGPKYPMDSEEAVEILHSLLFDPDFDPNSFRKKR